MKHIFIVNPVSGKNKGIVAGKIIEEYCKNINIDYKVIYTTKKDDAEKIASLYKDNYDNIIYSVGGDGTLNEIVNGMAYSNASIGVIPVGSGNDFYKNLLNSNINKVDLGKVNNRYFINVASLGLDAEIAKYANEIKKYKIPSKMIYILSIVKNFFVFNNIEVSTESLTKTRTIVTVCNGKFYGGGFKIAPNADLNDGLFDVLEVGDLNKLEIIKLISKLVTGNHLNQKKVEFYRTDNVKYYSDIPLCCNVDGEIIEGISFEFSLKKDAIKIHQEDDIKVNKLLKEKRIIK